MKKRIIALALAAMLSLGSFQMVNAGAGLDSAGEGNEIAVESVSIALANDTKEGKYKLVDTATLKAWSDKGTNMVVIDTMPGDWFAERHIPGAINAFAPLKGETYTKADKANLLKQVEAACKVKKNGKTKIDKNKKIVVYCGFVKCTRSHVAAKYLVSKGYKNVYRQPGGISSWIDAGYAIEGTDAAPVEEETPVETPAN